MKPAACKRCNAKMNIPETYADLCYGCGECKLNGVDESKWASNGGLPHESHNEIEQITRD